MTRTNLTTPAFALVLASSLLTLPALAQTKQGAANSPATKTAPVAAADAKSDSLSVMRFSEDGSRAIRAIGAALVAIFNGNPKLASTLITKAKESLAKAEQEAPTFKVQLTTEQKGKVQTESETGKAQMVPIDGDLVLAEGFVPTPEKRARIDKANEHFRNGKAKEALEELRLGDIAVMYNRAWMPLASTSKRLDQATKLMDDQKFYEANLALKAVNDSIMVDSVVINEPMKKTKS